MRASSSGTTRGAVTVWLEGDELAPVEFTWRPECVSVDVDPATGEVLRAHIEGMAMPPTRDLTEAEVAALMAAHDIGGLAREAARGGEL